MSWFMWNFTKGLLLRFEGSFAGLGFLALYLSGKIKCFDRRGHVAKLCIIFLPILAACLVAVSRVDDYWHHWQDVFAGGVLGLALSFWHEESISLNWLVTRLFCTIAGLVVATFCYLQFFPAPYHTEGKSFLRSFAASSSSNCHVLTLFSFWSKKRMDQPIVCVIVIPS